MVIACRSAREAGEVALAVRDGLDPLWIEVAGSGGLADGPGDGAAVAVGLGGLAAEVEHGAAQVRACAAASGCRAVTLDDAAALRARLAQFDVEPAAAVLRAATLPVEVGAVLEAAQAAARERGTAVRTLAHAANGIVRIAVLRPADVEPLLGALRPRLESAGGSLVVQRALPEVKARLDVWGATGIRHRAHAPAEGRVRSRRPPRPGPLRRRVSSARSVPVPGRATAALLPQRSRYWIVVSSFAGSSDQSP